MAIETPRLLRPFRREDFEDFCVPVLDAERKGERFAAIANILWRSDREMLAQTS